jgi:hypothetical protein
MTRATKRRRRETKELPRGIGGAPPHRSHGPITALRVLGEGVHVLLDTDRAELRIGRDPPPTNDVQLAMASISRMHAVITRKGNDVEVTDRGSTNGIGSCNHWWPGNYVRCDNVYVHAGDRFALGGVRLLALDEATHQLAMPLTAYCGSGSYDEVDRALAAITWNHMIVLCASRGDDVVELARTLHDGSIRNEYAFTRIDKLPRSDAAIEDLCTRAGCGTIFLDLTKRFSLPESFVRNVMGTHFHLWTIVAARTTDELFRRFGTAWYRRPFGFDWCCLGFPRLKTHLNLATATFSAGRQSGA